MECGCGLPADVGESGTWFDSAAIALDFYLEIDAEPAAEFSIAGDGTECGSLRAR